MTKQITYSPDTVVRARIRARLAREYHSGLLTEQEYDDELRALDDYEPGRLVIHPGPNPEERIHA